ncbi:MAG: hypothetical protein ACTSRZ_16100 [Promethearchaeota archaeon]
MKNFKRKNMILKLKNKLSKKLKDILSKKRKIDVEISKNTFLRAEFPFIREDCFLIAQVNGETGQQQLIIQKRNLENNRVEFEDRITCIHTVICDITPEYIEEGLRDGGFQKEILRIRSLEEVKELNLDPMERFKAFKSWVAGISEAGINAFKIQSDIDKLTNIVYPIVYPLLKFMIKVNPEFIYEYLDKIEKECMYEGVLHQASLMANLEPILEALWEIFLTNPSQTIPFFERIIELNPPIEIFEKKKYNIFISEEVFQKYSRFKDFLHYRDIDIMGFAISNEIKKIQKEIGDIELKTAEEAKKMGDLYHKQYIYKKDLKAIEEIRSKELRKSLVKLNEIILKNKEIFERLPISLVLERYKAENGDITLIIHPYKPFELNYFHKSILESVLRKFLQHFALRKINLKLGNKIKRKKENFLTRFWFKVKYKIKSLFELDENLNSGY